MHTMSSTSSSASKLIAIGIASGRPATGRSTSPWTARYAAAPARCLLPSSSADPPMPLALDISVSLPRLFGLGVILPRNVPDLPTHHYSS